MAKIKVIPPKEAEAKRLRVAAYCRVSTDSADQLHSYAAQIRNYTELIKQHDDWELIDVYADSGTTGTRIDQRDEFNRMMSDCQKGKIDRILVKSISRFARNTHDCLVALRELMRLGVTVKFEEDNIDTGMLTNEMLVSISGALAQQESVSISQNLRMSYKRRMERGEFITQNAPFGYRLINKKDLEIDPDQAKVVKWIFESYLSGKSLRWIAEQLTRQGIKTAHGSETWNFRSVEYIIKNEKYIGDSLCQKTFRTGFPYVVKENHGERDRYYIESTHPPIIDRGTFERARQLMDQKSLPPKNIHSKSLMTRKIICGVCGGLYIKVGQKRQWCCKAHSICASLCTAGRISETEVYAAFVRMYNKLKLHMGTILQPAINQLDELTTAANRDNPAMLEINRAIAQLAEQNYKVSKLQAKGMIDADVCNAKVRAINTKLTELRYERQRLMRNDSINERINIIKQTVDAVENGPERLDKFDSILFTEMVEQIIVESQTLIRFRLYGGLELKENIRRLEQW